MSRTEGRTEGRTVLERDGELRTIGAAIESAERGAGSLVVVEAPAGLGKSRLLDEAGRMAAGRGMAGYAARGGLFEKDQAYGAIRLLLERPLSALSDGDRTALLGGAASLAAPALAPAITARPIDTGRSEDGGLGGGVDHGLYWVIARLAERGPLLIAVDDIQWFDAPSARFLVYLARRIHDLPVVLLAATRPLARAAESPAVHELLLEPGVQELRPRPLSTRAVATLMNERWGRPVDPDFAETCRIAVAGNPFLLTRLVDALVAEDVPPTRGSCGRIEAVRPPAIARSILRRIDRMPAEAGALARAAAVLGADVSLEIVAQVADVEVEEAAAMLDLLAAEQILAPRLPIEFVHPIVREAVRGRLGPAESMRLHERAAAAMSAAGRGPEAVAPHLLLAPAEGRPETVQILRQAAAAARDRGAPDLAGRYLRRALSEPADGTVRPELLVELGATGLVAGDDPDELTTSLREALTLIPDPADRRTPWLVLSKVHALHDGVPGAVSLLDEALTDLADLHPALLAPLEHELCGQGLMHPATHAATLARLGAPPASGRTVADRLALCVHASVHGFAGSPVEQIEALALAALADGALDRDLGPESTTRHQLAYVLASIERSDLALALLDTTLADSTARGSAFGVAGALGTRSITRFMSGDLADAEADGVQALGVPGIPPTIVPAISAFTCLAMIERGALDEADAVIAASGCGPELPQILTMHYAFWACGRLRAAQGRSEEALEAFEEFGRRARRVGLETPVVSWRADAALLLARLGRREEALGRAEEYAAAAELHGTPRVVGIARRVAGLLTGGAAGERLLRESVDLLTGSPARLELAHSLAELGAAVRRSNRRREALDLLARAGNLADACGARALAARIDQESVTAGGSARGRLVAGPRQLTASELRVAQLAADGRTNREIAEELYISAKTVENHLGRAYAKLAISSRTELGRALAPRDLGT
ncbi:AAA family ATPase [Nocardioides carbamazepini]|uniref:LuxR C-terminal-related transcriptional regulator n=1 Tax=Nocardioides carbamazepini TaxID=2854259 RepID=UPI00214A3F19|nr:LuxR family transcriptional regulator [Nocardioides carbamazepini]MCR1781834.1 AAA family ATPase [Nocardioides carbamazepini]